MGNNTGSTPLSRRDRLVVSGVCVVFGIAFGAVVIFSVVGLAAELGGWLRSRSWQPAMAEIGETHLRQTTRKGGVVFASARYRYSVNGVTFDGTRLGWNDSTWIAFSDWQEDIYHELTEAKNAGQRFVVWHDPANPDMAVVDRGFRWGLLVFLLPLALFFSAVSLAAFWLLRNLWRR